MPEADLCLVLRLPQENLLLSFFAMDPIPKDNRSRAEPISTTSIQIPTSVHSLPSVLQPTSCSPNTNKRGLKTSLQAQALQGELR